MTTLLFAPVNTMAATSPANPTDSKNSTNQTKPTETSKTESRDVSGALTQSYNADPSVQVGMIVELKPKDPKTVVPLSPNEIRNMLGVVIPDKSAAIVLSPEKTSKQQVLVASSGHYSILVSSQNGPIKTGDYLTISSLPGIAMKASQEQKQIVGKATADFSGNSNVIGSIDLKDVDGKKQSVALGRIAIDIDIITNPLFSQTADYVPGFLASVANTVSDKPVSVARIYLSTALLLVISIITGNMLYSGVRSGMKAVGRNPLSKKSIIKSLIQTIVAGLIVFIAGVFGVYLLLKL